jgi:hypothetical protein
MTTFGDVRAAVASGEGIGLALSLYDDSRAPAEQALCYALDHRGLEQLALDLRPYTAWEMDGRAGFDVVTVVDRWESSVLTAKLPCHEHTWMLAKLPMQRAALRLRREAFEKVWMPSMGQSTEPAFVQMTRALSAVLATLEAYIQGWVSYDEVEHEVAQAWPLQRRITWVHPWSDAEQALYGILYRGVSAAIDELSHIPTAREADGVTLREQPIKRNAVREMMCRQINVALITEALTAFKEGLR